MAGPLAAAEIAAIVREYPEISACKTFVEAGGAECDTVSQMATLFRECHSIEVSEQRYNTARERCAHLGIQFHLGEASSVLQQLCPRLAEPTVFFLDTIGPGAVPSDDPSGAPLLSELAAIAARKKQDLIVIDDIGLFGSTSTEARAVTPERIMAALGSRRIRDSFCRNDRMFILLAQESCGAASPPSIQTAPAAPRGPSREIPAELRDAFTMNGTIPVEHEYAEARSSHGGSPKYSVREITTEMYHVFLGAAGENGFTDYHLYEALKSHAIGGKRTVVYSSPGPRYEGVALAYGATWVTSIQDGPAVSEHPLVGMCRSAELERAGTVFDAGIAIGSFEHLGLGRDGEVLAPDADVEAMKSLRTVIKPGGLLFLGLPLGRDRLIWNTRRVYGRARAPLLLEGWQHVATYGLAEGQLDSAEWQRPVLVLTPAPEL